MVLPIYVYGWPVLRKVAEDFDLENEKAELSTLIENMFETMYKADGVGLAGPQVGLSKRIFVIDASPLKEDDPDLANFKKVFINARIINKTGDKWIFNEGCLSLPEIREDIDRPEIVIIEYFNEHFELKKETFSGIKARIIQHEYDHLDGILFPDLVSPLKKRLLKSKLMAITKGKVDTAYKIKIPNLKQKIFN